MGTNVDEYTVFICRRPADPPRKTVPCRANKKMVGTATSISVKVRKADGTVTTSKVPLCPICSEPMHLGWEGSHTQDKVLLEVYGGKGYHPDKGWVVPFPVPRPS